MSTPTVPQTQNSVSIRQATTPQDIQAFKDCLNAYMEWLDEDVSFQNYDEEKSSLPGAYVPPFGALLLAVDSSSDEVLGCVAIRPLKASHDQSEDSVSEQGHKRCEMKRLFVYPAARGRQVARLLIRESLVRATEGGYRDVVLDSLPKMTAALALYKSEGFEEISPYYHSPIPGTIFLKKILS